MGVFRLFLALSVLLGHTRGHGLFGLSFVYPEIAVQTFFMISGFYMALILNEKYTHPGRYKTFLEQRFLRLYPTYLILILLVLLVDLSVYWATGSPWGSLKKWYDNIHLLSPAGIAFYVLENLVILGQEVVMILGLDQTTGAFQLFWHNNPVKPLDGASFLLIPPSWSLAVEFSFYLVAPLLVCRSVWIQMTVLLLSFAIRAAIFLALPAEGYHWIYCLFPPNVFFFMAGSLSYVLYKHHQERLRQLAVSKPWIIVLFALLALDYCRFPYTRQLYLIWMPLVFIMVPLLFSLTCRNRIDRLIGELSYPCYLIHAHVLLLTLPLLSAPKSQWLIGPVSVAMTLVLSYLFYLIVETRTERFREGLYKKQLQASQVKKEVLVAAPESSVPTAN